MSKKPIPIFEANYLVDGEYRNWFDAKYIINGKCRVPWLSKSVKKLQLIHH